MFRIPYKDNGYLTNMIGYSSNAIFAALEFGKSQQG